MLHRLSGGRSPAGKQEVTRAESGRRRNEELERIEEIYAMLMPKKVKYRKQQRGRMTGKAWRGSSLSFGDYG